MIPEAIIFDWAGTLIDPGCNAPVKAFHAVFDEIGIAVSEALIRRDMGLGKRSHIERLLAEPDVARRFEAANGRAATTDDADRLYQAVTDAMAALAPHFCEPVPGAAALLLELRENGVQIGSTTGYPRRVMDKIVPLAAAGGIAPDVIVCAEEVADPRPGPDQIFACLAALGVGPTNRVVKVDDSVSGLIAGRTAGCVTIAVTASGNPLDEQAVRQWADGACNSVAELGPCLSSL